MAIALEAYLDGCLLVFTHKDVPGIIGGVGTVFGQHGVNIGQMAVGRAGDQAGGDAIGILNLDAPPSPEALEGVRQLAAIGSAKVIHLPPAGELALLAAGLDSPRPKLRNGPAIPQSASKR